MLKNLTRSASKKMQQPTAKTASQKPLCSKRSISIRTESVKPFDEYSIPSRFFNCAPIIISEVADVNALVTGTDIKSTMKPTNNYDFEIRTKAEKLKQIINNKNNLFYM